MKKCYLSLFFYLALIATASAQKSRKVQYTDDMGHRYGDSPEYLASTLIKASQSLFTNQLSY